MDLKNKKILFELDLNSRQTNKQIAKKVKLSQQVTSYRIKGLLKKGIIKNLFIRTNNILLNYMHFKVYLRMQNLEEKKEKELIKRLKNNKNVFWLVKTRGNFDFIITILAQNIQEFTEIFNKITNKYGNHFIQRQVIIVESATTFSRGYLLNKEPEEFKYKSGNKIQLDEEDKQILKILSNDARKPAIEIANKLKVSSDKIIYRIKKLIKNNFITGFGVRIDRKKIGIKYYLLNFKLQNMNKTKYNKFKELTKKNKHILHFIKTIGNHDLELELEVKEEEELDQLIKQIKNNFFNEVKTYDLIQIKKEYKLNYFPF